MFPNGLKTTRRTGGWNHTPLSLVAWSLSHSKNIWIYLDQQTPSLHSGINQDSCAENPHVPLRIMHLLNFPAKAKYYVWIPVLFVVFSISGWELVVWWQQDDIRWNDGILQTCIIYLTDYATGDAPFRCANRVQLKIFRLSNVDPMHLLCVCVSHIASFFLKWCFFSTGRSSMKPLEHVTSNSCGGWGVPFTRWWHPRNTPRMCFLGFQTNIKGFPFHTYLEAV